MRLRSLQTIPTRLDPLDLRVKTLGPVKVGPYKRKTMHTKVTTNKSELYVFRGNVSHSADETCS